MRHGWCEIVGRPAGPQTKKLFEQLLRFGGGSCNSLWVSEFDEAYAKSPFEDLSHQLAERVLRWYVFRTNRGRIAPLPRKPSFGRHLRDARVKRGLSAVEVAKQVGVSVQSIYFWESDHVRPRDANLSALCRVLKLPVRATREMAQG